MQVKILVNDKHTNPLFNRFVAGDTADVIEHYARVSADRKWHYKVKLHDRTKSPEGRGLSSIVFFTKDQVEEI